MSESAAFLARFALWASLLFSVWEGFGPQYVDAVAPATNALSRHLGLPVHLERQGETVLHEYAPPGGRSFRIRAHDQGSIYLNLVVAVALFAATPRRSLAWRCSWATAAVGLLWASHVVSFFVSGQVALWQIAGVDPQTVTLVQQLAPYMPRARGEWLLRLFEQWNMWARYGLCVAMWFGAYVASPASTSVTLGHRTLGRLRAEGVPAT